MAWLVKRKDQGGGYLLPPGGRWSWTKDPAKARRFKSYLQAEKEACPENEMPVYWDDVLQRLGR